MTVLYRMPSNMHEKETQILGNIALEKVLKGSMQSPKVKAVLRYCTPQRNIEEEVLWHKERRKGCGTKRLVLGDV